MPEQDPQSTPPEGGSPPAGGTPPSDAEVAKLNQLRDWANSWGAREKQEGRNAIAREVAEKLGMTIDEAADALKKHRETEEANLSEAEKRLNAAKEAREEARRTKAEAHEIILNTLKVDALMDLGMPREAARASVDLVKVDTKATVTVESVVEAAAAVKTIFPQLFSATPPPAGGYGSGNGSDRPSPPHSVPGGQPPAGTGTGQAPRDRAMARLRERHPSRTQYRSDDVNRPPEMNAQRGS